MKKKHLLIPLLMMFSVTGCVMYNGLEKEEAEHEHTYVAVEANRKPDHGPKDPIMIEREARVLELLAKEGYLK